MNRMITDEQIEAMAEKAYPVKERVTYLSPWDENTYDRNKWIEGAKYVRDKLVSAPLKDDGVKEAADNWVNTPHYDEHGHRGSFIAGAKWMEEYRSQSLPSKSKGERIEYKTEKTWFDNFYAYWIKECSYDGKVWEPKITKIALALSLESDLDAAGMANKIIQALKNESVSQSLPSEGGKNPTGLSSLERESKGQFNEGDQG